MKTTASNLHNRVRLERAVHVQNNMGQLTVQWEEIATVFADVRFKSGLEQQRNAVDYGEVTASVRLRRREDISNQDRCVLLDWQGLVLAIEAVLPDMVRREFMDLSCRAGRNDGD